MIILIDVNYLISLDWIDGRPVTGDRSSLNDNFNHVISPFSSIDGTIINILKTKTRRQCSGFHNFKFEISNLKSIYSHSIVAGGLEEIS